MKILVIGGGGREHALVWKISKSPKVKKIFCAPGNAGIGEMAACVPINPGEIQKLLDFAEKEKIDLTIVGPEAPLAMGIVDLFTKKGLKVFGASKKAAEIESSKSFAKSIMNKYQIPTATGRAFTSFDKASEYVKKLGAPLVVKADGLAAGKGVFVCETEKEAVSALTSILTKKDFGDSGKKVVVEECLKGEEASFIAFTDGKTLLPLPLSQDHKAIFDGDSGPNTGGMGAYSPAPVVDTYLQQKIMDEIMAPMVKAMAAEGRPYKGVLYAGLMIDGGQAKVLEFNARFGDPEAQPLLMRVKNDIVPIMEATIEERLHEFSLDIDPRATVCVVMASGGYPGHYKKGMPLSGLPDAGRMRDVVVFHAGTAIQNGKVVASGGRVLGVTAIGDTVQKAISKAYKAVAKISWDNHYFRKDIGQKALRRLERAPEVSIIMGSDSDIDVMKEAAIILKKFDIPYEMTITSAHRSPMMAADFARNARKRGIKVVIAGAGQAAHLAGAIAAWTSLPVIGVPINSSSMQGMDALLSTVQMPNGIPVATMAIGKSGAANAGILSVQILGVSNHDIASMLDEYKEQMALKVQEKAKKFERLFC